MTNVSIIIPSHNRASLLQHAVESVLAQTFTDFEIIIVDDASTDETLEVVRKLHEMHGAKIMPLRNEVNLGSSGSRNRGIQASSGKWIGFLDDDDIYEPTKLQKQVDLLKATPDAGIVYCGYYFIHMDGTHELPVIDLPEGDVLKNLLLGCPVIMNAPLVRREYFERYGMFDETLELDEDWELWLRFAVNGCKFVCVKEALCAYRKHESNKTRDIEAWSTVQIKILDRIFSMPDLTPDILAMKSQAYAHSRITAACAYFARGAFQQGGEILRLALPEVELRAEVMAFLVGGLAHAVLASHTNTPEKFVHRVCDEVTPTRIARQVEARTLSLIYFELANRAFLEHHSIQVWTHGIHALKNNFIGLVRNRGFASMMIKALFV